MYVNHLLKINKEFKFELDEARFQHDMAYGDFKDLERRTQSDKVLKDKAMKLNKINN